MPTKSSFLLTPIGIVHSPYQEKFGIPRQPNLVTAARTILVLSDQFTPDSIAGLGAYSHLWVIFRFHQTITAGWKQKVRPPRLGGNTRMGVFATRSMFRPNGLGLSLLKLEQISHQQGQVCLVFQGGDLLEGTPVLDIKPYLPYADTAKNAQAGMANAAPDIHHAVRFSVLAQQQCETKALQWQVDMALLVEQILQQDPRPAYRQDLVVDQHEYGMRLYDFDLRWRYDEQGIEVTALAAKQQ